MREILRLARRTWCIFRTQGLCALWQVFINHVINQCPGTQQEYSAWIVRNEPSPSEQEKVRQSIATWENAPLISVVMPVFNTPAVWLSRAIESVQAQIYPNWELCIADDASTRAETQTILKKFASADARIRIEFRSINGHISQASNTALALARGDFIALLDHDDELHPLALAHVALALRQHPDACIIYSDEDKLDERGRRTAPYFKPAFNYELFLSHNMISHLGVYRKNLVDQAGGFRDTFVGAQDYDLALRCLERISHQQVLHIPKVLYHWRIHSSATAFRGNTKPYAIDAALRAVSDHLQRLGTPAQIEENVEAQGMHRLRFQNTNRVPTVSLILYGDLSATGWHSALDNFCHRDTGTSHQITLLGPHLNDDLISPFGEDCRLRWEKTEGFYAAINSAAQDCQTEFLCLIDARLQPLTTDWLDELLIHGRRSGIGVVGARLWGSDKRLRHAGIIIGAGDCAAPAHIGLPRNARGYFGRAVLLQEFSALSPACLLIRREILCRAGGFDRNHFRSDLGAIDLCLRLREHGLRNLWTPHAEVRYASTADFINRPELLDARHPTEIKHFKQRWRSFCVNDPCYSPNLSLADAKFSLAEQTRCPPDCFD